MRNESELQYKEELEDLLLQLAPIPAPSGKEEQRQAFCVSFLEQLSCGSVQTDAAGNVIYTYLPPNVSEDEANALQCIVLDAHMDVVFPDLEPLPLYEEDGKIFCPGVGDDTANLVVLLMLAKHISRVRPEIGRRKLLFVCSTGEEGLGNLKGMKELFRNPQSEIEAFCSFDLTMDQYTCRAVGSRRYRLSVRAQGGHSFSCFGNSNANVLLAELITSLYQLSVPEQGVTTYNVGLICGGTSVNTIAENAEAFYEIRSDHAASMDEMEQRFRETTDQLKQKWESDQSGTLSIELLGERPCEKNVPAEKRQAMFHSIEHAVEQITGKKPEPVPCSTNCNIPLSLGIPSICVGTCRGAGAHTREEYIEKDSLIDGFRIAVQLLRELTQN